MTHIILNTDFDHVFKLLDCLILPLKSTTMASKKQDGTLVPRETPPQQVQPEVKPPVEPVSPVVPAEDPHLYPKERPEEISPYDFPPPGDDFFPEIF